MLVVVGSSEDKRAKYGLYPGLYDLLVPSQSVVAEKGKRATEVTRPPPPCKHSVGANECRALRLLTFQPSNTCHSTVHNLHNLNNHPHAHANAFAQATLSGGLHISPISHSHGKLVICPRTTAAASLFSMSPMSLIN